MRDLRGISGLFGFISDFMVNLTRRQKRLALMAADLILVAAALWGSVAVRIGALWPGYVWDRGWWLLIVLPPIGVAIFRGMGLYRLLMRTLGHYGILINILAVVQLSILLMALAYLHGDLFIPRSTPIIFALMLAAAMIALRAFATSIYGWKRAQSASRLPVLIYGAGESGIQLVSALKASREFQPVAFLDDNPALIGNFVSGYRVHDPAQISRLTQRYQVGDILLAMPSISRARRKEIIAELSKYPLRVRSVPSMVEIVAGFGTVDQLRKVGIEELLDRERVDPLDDLFDSVRGRAVLVTGAGGSIGSELCRQILATGASKLVLYEHSEPALYSIEMELRDLAGPSAPDIVPVLGSVCDEDRFEQTVQAHEIQTIYHAAAYKHVPLVEANPFAGIRNNVFGTLVVAEVAARAGVERAILVSTDKAVRPTNIMGATKRIAEYVFQNAQRNSRGTLFSAVRFGNVMGSSGSVIPLFTRQIAAGGPVTVTHPEVIRYFMTIPEAAQLVIQAGSMSQGGDVFLLDMGEPVAILDLARRMIRLSGLEVKDADNPDGDIEIAFTGLRPGEKLFEELLVSGNPLPTRHPKIMRAHDARLQGKVIEQALADLRVSIAREDLEALHRVLRAVVEGYEKVNPGYSLRKSVEVRDNRKLAV